MLSADDLWPIGHIATAANTTVTTVRYYDEIGLIQSAARVGGQRRFHSDTIGRITFIRRAQDAGLNLEEIGAILSGDVGGWRELVASKRSELVDRRRAMDKMIALLDEVQECGCVTALTCPEQPSWNSPSTA